MNTIKRTKRQTTEKILRKLGQTDITNDGEDFDSLCSNFHSSHESLVKILSRMQLYMDTMQRWQKAGAALSDEIGMFLHQPSTDGTTSEYHQLKEIFTSFALTQESIKEISNQVNDQWSAQVISPMRDLTHIYDKKLQQRIKQRELAKIDYDVYRRRAKGTTSKTAAQRNFEKLAVAQKEFESQDFFIRKELLRRKEQRSQLIVEELRFAVGLERRALKLIRASFTSLPELFPNDIDLCRKRRHIWLVNGCKETFKMVGYDTTVQQSESTPFHRIRDAPRGKPKGTQNASTDAYELPKRRVPRYTAQDLNEVAGTAFKGWKVDSQVLRRSNSSSSFESFSSAVSDMSLHKRSLQRKSSYRKSRKGVLQRTDSSNTILSDENDSATRIEIHGDGLTTATVVQIYNTEMSPSKFVRAG